MRRNPVVIATSALVMSVALTVLTGQGPPAGDSGMAPKYTKDGELILPVGYREWVFCGADLGLAYAADPTTTPREKARVKDDVAGPFHNIYINRAAYEAYAKSKTKTFPDKTVLVMELFESEQKEPMHIVSHGRYEAKRVGLEVAVKNTQRPDGSKTDWAYYIFTDATAPTAPPLLAAKAQPDSDCYNCHRKHADVDNVWVQFYPTLRDLKGN
jgi:Cytochrome P460